MSQFDSEIVGAHDVTAREVESWGHEPEPVDNPLREEFIVCFAPGYPDPYRLHPPTLEQARKFVADHGWNYGTNEKAHPVIKRRFVTDWEEVA